jgi:nucleoside diphosphate kinase
MIEKFRLKSSLATVKVSDAQARASTPCTRASPSSQPGKFMTSGPAVVMAIEGENAIALIARYCARPTPRRHPPHNPEQYGTNIERNAVHGSDGPNTPGPNWPSFSRA